MLIDTLTYILAHYIAIAILAILSCGVGCRITKGVDYHSVIEKIAIGTGLGLGVIASFIFALGLMQLLYSTLAIGALVLVSVICAPTLKEVGRELVESLRVSRKHLLAGGIASLLFLLSISIPAFYPPFYFVDVTSYHLALAKISVQTHQVAMTPFLRYPVFPQLNEMLFSLALLLYDDILAQFVQFLMMLLVAAALFAWGQRAFSAHAGLVAGALWLGTPLVLWLGAWAGIDIGLTLFVTLGICSFSNWLSRREQSWLVLSAVFIGFAAGSKYSALFFIGALGLATSYWAIRDRNWKYPIIFGVISTLVAAPWYLYNLYYTGNPVFPFFADIFGYGPWTIEDLRFQIRDLAYWGTGRTVQSFLLLPWNLVFNQQEFHLTEAPLLPFYILALPIMALLAIKHTSIRGLVVLSTAYIVFWFSSAQVLRYLLPIVPLLSLVTAVLLQEGLQRLQFPRDDMTQARLLVVSAILLLLYGAFTALNLVRHLGLPPFTVAEREPYYENRRFSYDAYKLLNSEKGRDYAVYVLGEEYMAMFADGTFMGDWVGPARFGRITQHDNGQDLYQELVSLKATHFLVNLQEAASRFPEFSLPQDEFFQSHFQLVYAYPYIRLYELTKTPKLRKIGPQLLLNPSFEELQDNQPKSWKHIGTPVVDNSVSHSGSVATESRGVLNAYYQVVAVKPGGYYILGEFARALSQKQRARLQVHWSDAQSNFLGVDIQAIEVGPGWKYYEMAVTPPKQAAFAGIYANAEGESSVWFDDLSFVQVQYEPK